MKKAVLGWNVWISGASSGIGAALARELGKRGCRVAVFARREEELQRLAEEIRADCGAEIIVKSGDVSNRDEVLRAVREAEEKFGGLDLAVLNAGINETFSPKRWSDESIERIFRVNFFGAIYGIEAILPGMLERGRGHIACTSSIAAVGGLPTAAPYSSSKAALNTFLESLRSDLRGRGVTFTTVTPGFVRTPLTDRNRFPMPFLLEVDDAARRIVRGLEKRQREIHFPWRLTVPLKILGALPRRWFEWIIGWTARRGYHKTDVTK